MSENSEMFSVSNNKHNVLTSIMIFYSTLGGKVLQLSDYSIFT